VGSSTGRFDVGTERLVISPTRGRTDELKLIGASVTTLAQGRGGVVVIEGPPDIGKSRLLTEMMVLAGNCGVHTLFGEAFVYQQSVSFVALFTATLRNDPPVGDADALRRLGSSADRRYWVVHDLADAIQAVAAEPLAIVPEDIHRADSSTLLALRSLAATRRPDVPMLWVFTARTGAGAPGVHETLSVLQRANATFVRVPAMSPFAVADMVRDVMPLTEEESDALHAAWPIPGAGRPLFEGAGANFSRHSAATVDTNNARRRLLPLTSGTGDHVVPLKATKEVVALYAKGPADTDFHVFEGKGHYLTIDNGWREVTDVA
jgi:hypothetical protein